MEESFFGYRFTGVVEKDANALHDGPTKIDQRMPLMKYVAANISKYPEIRIVDTGDLTVMQIINQRLIFPMPEGVTVPPIWDEVIGKFVPYVPDEAF